MTLGDIKLMLGVSPCRIARRHTKLRNSHAPAEDIIAGTISFCASERTNAEALSAGIWPLSLEGVKLLCVVDQYSVEQVIIAYERAEIGK